MGNNLSGLTPNASVSVEQVLVDFENWNHEKLLGSSRFFKVSKIRMKKERKSGVLKVFKYPDWTKAVVEKYSKLMQSYCTSSYSLNNVMSYRRCFIKNEVAFLLRDFSDYSLTVRMRTRPFLTIEEKKWIAFQILCGLTQCHKERLHPHYSDPTKLSNNEFRLCHGDLKTENIMLTDWGWVFLADMAPFKPVYLPANNPSEFYFFFNISGKDHPACYLAPERFVDAPSVQSNPADTIGNKSSHSRKTELSETESNDGLSANAPIDLSDQSKQVLQPSMDMFSVGCIFIELFTDGIIPFDLENLLKYRNRDFTKLNSVLQKIHDTHIQTMIKQLLNLSPIDRITAEECLISQRGKSFPDVFYRDLKGYMVQYLDENLSDPDIRMKKFFTDFPGLFKTYLVYPKGRHIKNETLILFVNFITASIFLVEEEQSKINCLVMLKELGLYMTNELVLDRIVPFLLEFINYKDSTEVRRIALDCVVLSVQDINPTNPADISFFPDYLLPLICELQKDPSVSIRYSFARHIPSLAKTSQRFLVNCVKLQKSMQKSKEKAIKYDSELSHLRELFKDIIINLFAEEDVQIKCYVAQPHYLSDLSEFFNINKAIEILLSHLITFLNDKMNFTVRLAFYKCIPEVVQIMGIQSLTLIQSLLSQGLQDSNLQVVEICCHSLAKMIRLKLMPDWLKSDLFPNVVALFSLPYNSLRMTALDYTISFCAHTSLATVYTSFLKCDQYSCIFKLKEPLNIENYMESIIWANLKPPINREIFENIIRSSEAEDLLEFLKIRQKTNGEHKIPFLGGDISLNYQFKKLQELGMTVNEESQILLLYKLILEIVNSRRPLQNFTNKKNKQATNVSPFNSNIPYYNYKSTSNINSKDHFPEVMTTIDFETSINIDSIPRKSNVVPGRVSTPNQGKDSTWENLFDSKPSPATDPRKNVEFKLSLGDEELTNTEIAKTDTLELPLKKSDNLKFTTSIYKSLSTGASYINGEKNFKSYVGYLPTAWKPKGILVGNLHEHRRGYTSILAHPSEKQMISSGTDKTIKIWNCDPNPNKPDATCSKYLPNKSTLSVSLENNQRSSPNGSCQNLVWTDNFSSIAVVVDRKYIHTVERNGEKKEVIDFPTEEYGFINSLTTPLESGCELDSSTQKTLIYSTTGNWIIAHDLRCPSPIKSIWCHKQDNDFGFITCLAVHSAYTWMVTGTSRGSLICWDLRFQKVVNQIDHPKRSGFLSIKINPVPCEISDNCGSRSAQIWASTEEFNEISSWNLESSCRITSLRTAAPEIKQPLIPELQNIKRQNSMNYFQSNTFHSKPFLVKLVGQSEQRPCILSGSSDCHLRFWDINDPLKSSMLSVGGLDQYSAKMSIAYKTFRDSANECVIEEKQDITFIEENLNRKRNFQPFTGHVANICDITTIMLGQPFVVSSSMDGVIKIWK